MKESNFINTTMAMEEKYFHLLQELNDCQFTAGTLSISDDQFNLLFRNFKDARKTFENETHIKNSRYLKLEPASIFSFFKFSNDLIPIYYEFAKDFSDIHTLFFDLMENNSKFRMKIYKAFSENDFDLLALIYHPYRKVANHKNLLSEITFEETQDVFEERREMEASINKILEIYSESEKVDSIFGIKDIFEEARGETTLSEIQKKYDRDTTSDFEYFVHDLKMRVFDKKMFDLGMLQRGETTESDIDAISRSLEVKELTVNHKIDSLPAKTKMKEIRLERSKLNDNRSSMFKVVKSMIDDAMRNSSSLSEADRQILDRECDNFNHKRTKDTLLEKQRKMDKLEHLKNAKKLENKTESLSLITGWPKEVKINSEDKKHFSEDITSEEHTKKKNTVERLFTFNINSEKYLPVKNESAKAKNGGNQLKNNENDENLVEQGSSVKSENNDSIKEKEEKQIEVKKDEKKPDIPYYKISIQNQTITIPIQDIKEELKKKIENESEMNVLNLNGIVKQTKSDKNVDNVENTKTSDSKDQIPLQNTMPEADALTKEEVEKSDKTEEEGEESDHSSKSDFQKTVFNAVRCEGCDSVYPQNYESICSFCDSSDHLSQFSVTHDSVKQHINDTHSTIHKILKLTESLKKDLKSKETEIENTKKRHQETLEENKKYMLQAQEKLVLQGNKIKSATDLKRTLKKDFERLQKEKAGSDKKLEENTDFYEQYRKSKEIAIRKFKEEIEKLTAQKSEMEKNAEIPQKKLHKNSVVINTMITLKEKTESELEKMKKTHEKIAIELDSAKEKHKNSLKLVKKTEDANKKLNKEKKNFEHELKRNKEKIKAAEAQLDQSKKENAAIQERFESFQKDYQKLKQGLEKEAGKAEKTDTEFKFKIVQENTLLKESLLKITKTVEMEKTENRKFSEKLEKSKNSVELTAENISQSDELLADVNNLAKERNFLRKELIKSQKKAKNQLRINFGLGVGVALMFLTFLTKKR